MARKPLNKSKLDDVLGRSSAVVKLGDVRRDGGTQPRAEMDTETVSEYAERMKRRRGDGLIIDPDGEVWREIVVFYDGETYWLADGFHRVEAALSSKLKEFQADVRQGTRRDALIYSLGANAKHGLRRTNTDKRRAVRLALWDDELKQLSDGKIGELCGVSQPFVSKLRRALKQSDDYVPPSVRLGADGKEYAAKKVTGRTPAPTPTPQNGFDVELADQFDEIDRQLAPEPGSDEGKVKLRHMGLKGLTKTIRGGSESGSQPVGAGELTWLEGDFRQHLKGVRAKIMFTQEQSSASGWDAIGKVAADTLVDDGYLITLHELEEVQALCTMFPKRQLSLIWAGIIRWAGDGPQLTQCTIWSRAGQVDIRYQYYELTRDFGGRQFFTRNILEQIAEPGDVLIDPAAGANVAPIAIGAAALGLDVIAVEADRKLLKEAKRIATNLLGGG